MVGPGPENPDKAWFLIVSRNLSSLLATLSPWNRDVQTFIGHLSSLGLQIFNIAFHMLIHERLSSSLLLTEQSHRYGLSPRLLNPASEITMFFKASLEDRNILSSILILKVPTSQKIQLIPSTRSFEKWGRLRLLISIITGHHHLDILHQLLIRRFSIQLLYRTFDFSSEPPPSFSSVSCSLLPCSSCLCLCTPSLAGILSGALRRRYFIVRVPSVCNARRHWDTL